MKNALIAGVLTMSIALCSSFTNNSNVKEQYQASNQTAQIDTTPRKKDSSKHKFKTVPYDSFGKPKTMDSLKSTQ